MAELQDAVIVSAVRTAIGTYGGGLAEVSAGNYSPPHAIGRG